MTGRSSTNVTKPTKKSFSVSRKGLKVVAIWQSGTRVKFAALSVRSRTSWQQFSVRNQLKRQSQNRRWQRSTPTIRTTIFFPASRPLQSSEANPSERPAPKFKFRRRFEKPSTTSRPRNRSECDAICPTGSSLRGDAGTKLVRSSRPRSPTRGSRARLRCADNALPDSVHRRPSGIRPEFCSTDIEQKKKNQLQNLLKNSFSWKMKQNYTTSQFSDTFLLLFFS